MNLLRPASVALLLLCAASAQAQNRAQISSDAPCEAARPSDPPCPTNSVAAPSGSVMGSPAPMAGDLRERTHSMILPTGNLLARGETQVQLNEFAIYNRVAYGVSDRVEINVGMFVVSAMSAGLKIALIEPDGAFRLVAGATVWKGTLGAFETQSFVHGGVTAAYQGDTINLHATLEVAQKLEGDSEIVGGYALGALGRLSEKIALSAEIVRVGLADSGDCCMDALVVGAKLMGESWDFDLGLGTPLNPDVDAFMFPILAASTKL